MLKDNNFTKIKEINFYLGKIKLKMRSLLMSLYHELIKGLSIKSNKSSESTR